MAMHRRPPASWISIWLNWRARKIEDPVARLAFLRRHATFAPRRLLITPTRIAAGAAIIVLGAILYWPSITSASRPFRAAKGLRGETQLPKDTPPNVTRQTIWLVEQHPTHEIYSNGLRIEIAGAVTHTPRRYMPLPRNHPEVWSQPPATDAARRTAPAGIVFHTTESELAPFQPSANRALQYVGVKLLEYVRHRKSYHYLIDRFGRIHRVVEEDRIANHAGWSVWADSEWVYVNLNDSFLGIAFEAQTAPGEQGTINDAQLHAGRILTDMLRAKYDIPAQNCTTHGQVSVNPGNMKIGNHTDLGMGFPYAGMGLPDNYRIPPPSLMLFGFTYDNDYWRRIEPRLQETLLASEAQLRQSRPQRSAMQRRYRDIIAIWRKQQDENL